MIFQDPFASLNPRFTIGSLIAEPMHIYKVASSAEIRERTAELLNVVGLRPEYIDRYPHEFSGGQRQRIAVARAISINPEFVIADEPVSALDVSIRAQVLNLLQRLQQQFNLTYLFVSHDLSVVRHVADRIAVMYLGRIVELADRDELYAAPKHPYTKALLSAVPIPDPQIEKRRQANHPCLVTCPVQSTFRLVVAFIHAVRWHRRSAAKLNPFTRRKKGANITQHVISLNLSHQLINVR